MDKKDNSMDKKCISDKCLDGNYATLPDNYKNYIFDLYGTLVDIRTDEGDSALWEKLAMFYGYYDAMYEPEELQKRYGELVKGKESELKITLETDPHYSHEASPEIEITDVFEALFEEKGVSASKELAVHAGQFFRVLSTDYVKVYPGTVEMLKELKERGKGVFLLSNAQRIFTAHEMNVLGISQYFDEILISSDFKTKKPDKRFFDIALEKYGIDIEGAIFVGNDSTTDIKGAKTVKLDTFYVKSNISPKDDCGKDATYSVDDFIGWQKSVN